ncbi:MAG: efflux RND transporter periplasmic adaptor subunit [Longimicrobiales bacterium]
MSTSGASVLLLVLTTTAFVSSCHRAEAQRGAMGEAPVVPVRVAQVIEDTTMQPIEAVGVLEPKEQVQLSFKVGGVVASVKVDEGQSVHAGQVLALLDLREIDAQVNKAKAGWEKTERDLARAQSLYEDSVATLEQLENATTAAQAARSDYEIARVNQRYATIVAPASGVVLRRSAEPGELVTPGQHIVELGSARAGVVLRAGLVDRDAVRVGVGDEAEVRFDAYPGVSFAGRVTEVAAAATSGIGTYAVEVSLAEAPSRSSGLIGHVRILPKARTRVLVVPIESIVEADGDEGAVFTIARDGSTARRIAVSIGAIDEGRVAITGGLDGVGIVISAGAAFIADGSKVKVVR